MLPFLYLYINFVMYKVYIQKPAEQFEDDWLYAAWFGFQQRGMKIFFFSDINEVPVSINNIVVAHVEPTLEYFKKLKIKIPVAFNVPTELKYYAKRDTYVSSIKEFKANEKLPVFVKPAFRIKSFGVNSHFATGVMSEPSSKSGIFYNSDDYESLFVSEVVDIVSEYRCFIHNGKLVGIQNYSGDFTVFPNPTTIHLMIEEFNPSVAYTLDVAITASGQTVLVESQDMWAIGNYGLSPKIYARLLLDRWLELVKVKQKELELTDVIGKHITEVDKLCIENGYRFRIQKDDDKVLATAFGANCDLKLFTLTLKDNKVISGWIG